MSRTDGALCSGLTLLRARSEQAGQAYLVVRQLPSGEGVGDGPDGGMLPSRPIADGRVGGTPGRARCNAHQLWQEHWGRGERWIQRQGRV